MPVLLTLSVAIALTILGGLHNSWIPLPWLGGIAMWAYYFWVRPAELPRAPSEPVSFPVAQFTLVLAAGALVRLYKITDLPLGPYSDEIFTLNNSLALAHRPFDFFGHTPLFTAGWVETANLYLYFNLLILKVFGVSYWSMKLFSVIPGIVACGAVFASARLLFSPRAALATALIFSFAHWPVRLSRYGWDVSFMVMAISLAIWLLLLAIQRGRPFYAYFAGVTSGLSLYSYLGARICLLSLLIWFALELALRREKWTIRHGVAFAVGMAMTACPLLFYFLAKPSAFWVRSAELSVFNSENPLWEIVNNGWRHALMFFTLGGTYARDNFPGLAMMDPLTGLLLLVGLVVALRDRKNYAVRLLACAFILNFTAGVFSVSQEGAPYVYRTSAVIIPAFLIVGFAVQWLVAYLGSKPSEGRSVKYFMSAVCVSGLLGIIALNCYFYFGLEARNIAAMRVMAYEARLLGLEIARDRLPVILVGRDMIEQPSVQPNVAERFAYANPPLILPFAMRFLAIVEFSGRFDQNRTLSDNLERPENIHFMESDRLASSNLSLPHPAKLIFRSQKTGVWDLVRANDPSASRRDIRNILGESLFTVATLAKSSALPADTSAGRLP